MEGLRPAWAAEYEQAHPGIRIWQNWRGLWAWRQQPGADEFTGALAHAGTRDELLGKLDG